MPVLPTPCAVLSDLVPIPNTVRPARRRSLRWTAVPVALSILASMTTVSSIHAQSGPPRVAAEIQQPAESPASDKTSSLMVLQSGRVVEGLISHAAGGYLVEIDAGSMFIPFEQVRFQADDLADAYRKLRRSMPDLTATNHIALSRWCMSHHQYHAARTELQDALSLEPDREEARALLVRLERLMTSVSDPQPTLPHVRNREEEDPFPGDTTALGGLSRDVARHYVTRIQPLLLNKCGNTRCHGSHHEGEFRLLRRSGPSRVLAERNLATILQQIDLRNPDASPLLQVPVGNHAARGGTVFFGPTGVEQFEDLRLWIHALAQEQQSAVAQASPVHPPRTPARSESTSAPEALTRRTTPGTRSPVTSPSQQTASPATVQPDRDFVDQVLQEEQPDAFDPNEFNRRYGSTQPAEPAASSPLSASPRFPPVSRPGVTPNTTPASPF